MRQALDHGLTGFTHLFNAMSPLTSREPGTVGAALESQTAWCGLIVDGRHVDPATCGSPCAPGRWTASCW
jgi:N-acetylglucosamine-6-phosphate deacetylase